MVASRNELGALQDIAAATSWQDTTHPGLWIAISRSFRDEQSAVWWALEVIARPYGSSKIHRSLVVTPDPQTLPDTSNWDLISNLPVSGSERASHSIIRSATVEEIVRLYGLRMWVEQSYKQVKGILEWAEYQVRSDQAIQRH